MGVFATIDYAIVRAMRRFGKPIARLAFFIVFFWFGILKLVNASPANPLVSSLLEKTLPFITFEQFIIFLGLWEMLIGVLFLIPHLERVAILLLVPHLFVTAAPLVLLPQIAWQSAFIPTLEGQYIIKNILIVSTALAIGSQVHPFDKRR